MVIDLKNKPVVDGELPSIWNDLPDDVARHLEPGYGHVVQQRIQNMLPLFYPGYLKELSAFERYQTNSRKQIYYAGDYLSHALLGGACRSGEDIAQAVISNWSG
jgi:oxygen-dependent protoporphyrinogen oxidase